MIKKPKPITLILVIYCILFSSVPTVEKVDKFLLDQKIEKKDAEIKEYLIFNIIVDKKNDREWLGFFYNIYQIK